MVLRSALEGDRLTVWRLDRLDRSLPHLVTTVEELRRGGVLFRSLSDPLDTSTATGLRCSGVFASFGQFERDRTTAGQLATDHDGHREGRVSTDAWAAPSRLMSTVPFREYCGGDVTLPVDRRPQLRPDPLAAAALAREERLTLERVARRRPGALRTASGDGQRSAGSVHHTIIATPPRPAHHPAGWPR